MPSHSAADAQLDVSETAEVAPSHEGHAETAAEEGQDAGQNEASAIDRLFDQVAHPKAPTSASAEIVPPASAPLPTGLRSARIVKMAGTTLEVQLRGRREAIAAQLGEGVDRALVARAMEQRDAVLVEPSEDPREGVPPLVIVGVLQTRLQTDIKLKGATITIEAEREVLIRAGKAAVRLREDGDIEVVGSRISAMSRGLFRIVGRVLRLN